MAKQVYVCMCVRCACVFMCVCVRMCMYVCTYVFMLQQRAIVAGALDNEDAMVKQVCV
jgi:hypothetical protein